MAIDVGGSVLISRAEGWFSGPVLEDVVSVLRHTKFVLKRLGLASSGGVVPQVERARDIGPHEVRQISMRRVWIRQTWARLVGRIGRDSQGGTAEGLLGFLEEIHADVQTAYQLASDFDWVAEQMDAGTPVHAQEGPFTEVTSEIPLPVGCSGALE